jgi:hypothetical protein
MIRGRILWTANGKAGGLALLLLSIALRIAVPTGWMPAGDGVHVMPCPGVAMPATMHHAPAGHHDDSQPAQSHGDTCAFAAFAVPLLAPVDSWTPPKLVPTTSWVVASVIISLVAGHALAAPPPPQTGPPQTF